MWPRVFAFVCICIIKFIPDRVLCFSKALSSLYLKLPVKLCVLETSPLICPLANVDIACEILKVPVFVGRVFFILIRNLDLQNDMSKEISQFYHYYYYSLRIASVLKVELLGNPLLYVFVSFFGPDRAERSIAFQSDFELTDQ